MDERIEDNNKINIVEVAARDGLQSEPNVLSVSQRVRFIDYLSNINYSAIEVGSFVSEKTLPQMANSQLVYSQLNKKKHIDYSILVPNKTGFQQALQHQVKHIAVFASVCEEFSKKNINCSIEDSMKRYRDIVTQACENNIRVRGYLSCVFGLSSTFALDIKKTIQLAEELLDLGCYEVSLSDTLGHATPLIVNQVLQSVANEVDIKHVAVHFHDTYGQGLVNCYAALSAGVRTFDSALGGLGGCPLAKGAGGNVATEELVYLLTGLGFDCGIQLEQLSMPRQYLKQFLLNPMVSKIAMSMDNINSENTRV